MLERNNIAKVIFKGIWRGLNFIRSLFLNLIFFIFALAVIIGLTADKENNLQLQPDTALVLDLSGELVLEKQYVDPMSLLAGGFSGEIRDTEILLRDLLTSIETAKTDPNISALVLDLQYFTGGGLEKLRLVAKAIEDFKSSGKPVYAMGDYYDRNQYYLASVADNLYLNPMGGLMIDGYARHTMYHREALDKLNATTHVFRVGTYKSAVEPFLRNDMSPEAKEANQLWLDELWNQYKSDVSNARQFPLDNFDDTFDSFLAKLESSDGDIAKYALDNGWVDKLLTREAFYQELLATVSGDQSGQPYRQIKYSDYSRIAIQPDFAQQFSPTKVAVIVAKGTILPGHQKAGTIGGDSTAALLNKARHDDTIKAVVLQVDSGGGSAFASEIIRQQVLELQKSGKPVVASMASVAASGGYWISTSADLIVAEPSTITGSIGIFGRLVTFEDTLAQFGVYTDGVSSTELGGFSITRGLPQGYSDYLQLTVEHGYDQFVSLVASTRGKTFSDINQVAQGRVWTGNQALAHGLVDELGGLDLAIKRASELAKLDDYAVTYVEHEKSQRDLMIEQLLNVVSPIIPEYFAPTTNPDVAAITGALESTLNSSINLHDPDNLFYLCTDCAVN